MKPEIVLAESAGFCFGVKRAVELCERTAEECGECFTLGSIIHNSNVVNRLRELGVRKADSIEEIPNGATVIIRSHGEAKAVYERLEQKNCRIVDATCPNVSKIHKIASDASERGRTVVVVGEANHPEITAVCGWCAESVVLGGSEDAAKYLAEHPEITSAPLTVVSQTTGIRKNYENTVNILEKQCTNVENFATICDATNRRQTEADMLSRRVDAMVVIGDKESANSRRLYEICQAGCASSFFVGGASELCLSRFSNAEIIGVTAGASTPQWIIKEVINKMSEEVRNEKTTVEPVVEEQVAEVPAVEEEESFEAMLEKSIKTLSTGDKVKGIVTAISATEVTVDLGAKQSGYISLSEITDDPTVKPEDLVPIGSEVEARVLRVNDVDGYIMLSKKRLDSERVWGDLESYRENKTIVEGKVTEDNKGGVVVMVSGVRVFVPASQTGLGRGADMSALVGQNVRLRITEVNRARRGRVVGSIRSVQYEERKAATEKIWAEIEEGKRYQGVVKSLTSYGAFVDIGGIDGMVHVSELSWSRIKNPAEVVSVGDQVEVYVISFDRENRKISLGLKDKNENPWLKFTNAYDVGSVAQVKIVKLMSFGAFAEIVPGVDGLIHISQIADHRIATPGEVLSEGDVVNVKITEIDNEKQKVSLSIRALLEQPEEVAKETVEE